MIATTSFRRNYLSVQQTKFSTSPKLIRYCRDTFLICVSILSLGDSWAQLQSDGVSTSNSTREHISTASISEESLQESLNEVSALQSEIESVLEKSTYDWDSLLDSLNYDAQEIVEFVKEKITFEQYKGVLRGPKGALYSRAGNSIDQAILLAKLLRDSGYDARIAGTKLSKDNAQYVVKQLIQTNEIPSAFTSNERVAEILRNYGVSSQSPSFDGGQATSARDSKFYHTVQETTEAILEKIQAGGGELGFSDQDAKILEEAREYYWVEFRDGAASPWESIHPVFAGEVPFERPAATTYIAEEIPTELQHRVRFQVFIERRIKGKLATVPITAAVEQPVANTIGLPFTFSNVGDSMLRQDALGEDLVAHAAASRSYMPSFNGKKAPGAQFFDLHGNLIDPLAAQDAAAGLFATINEGFRSATGAIGDESSLPILTAQFMEFTFISPGGEESRIRRNVFDLVGPSRRQSGLGLGDVKEATAENARSLLQRHTYMISVGEIPPAYTIHSGIERFKSGRSGVEALFKLRRGEPIDAASIESFPASWDGHLPLFALFDYGRTDPEGIKTYRSGPALVIHSDGLGEVDTLIERIDIVSNPSRTFDVRGEAPTFKADLNVMPGVWETATEALVVTGGRKSNTWTAFQSAAQQDIALVTLLPDDSLENLEFERDTLAAVSSDLKNGYAVIIPEKEITPGASGWWRVDLETGETLGQFGDGRGGELAEFAINLTISLSALTYGLHQCVEARHEFNVEMCCGIVNAGVSLFTFGMGSAASVNRLRPFFPPGGKFFPAWAAIHNIGFGATLDAMATGLPIGDMCEDFAQEF